MNESPKAKKIEHKITTHGDTRVDNYFWMRLTDDQKESQTPDDQTREVLQYLNAENEHLKSVLQPTKGLQEALYEEIIGRIKQEDQSVPVKVNGYVYYNRFETGQDYPLTCRKKNDENGDEEVLLNMPEMAEGHQYFSVGGQSVSENNELLAYSVDLISRRQYTIHFKNLVTGEHYADEIKNTTGEIIWASDNQTVFYTKQDPITLRSHQIYKHILGTAAEEDVLVYEEKDDTFGCNVSKTKSRKYILIESYQTLSTEYRFLEADNPDGEWTVFQPRERDLEYYVDHFEDHFYIVTNMEAKNFRLMKTLVPNTEKENWTEVIGHRDNVLLEDIDIFKHQFVITERKNGLTQLRVINWNDMSEHYIEFDDPAYAAYTFSNPEFETEVLRFGYTSLTTPQSTFDYHMKTRAKTLRKQQEVLGGKFSPENYSSERIMVPVRDGARVPVSIVYKNGFKRDGNAPLLLYAYGSYGYSMDATFSPIRLSLLDRGFVFAIAHIRGGQEMGRHWYEDGKLLKKKNTFYDFIDCGNYLVENNYTSNKHLYAQGGSAGGLLMGAITNMEPDMWNGIIAQVPFVDVVSTMLDESIPLTTGEFDEWGNPKNKEYYDYIKSYSPYDNIEKKEYPNILITTGYWDSQVQYWEPAKWIAKLREYKTDRNQLMMYCNMDVGHGGASGRFQKYKEVAMIYAFLLQLEGIFE